MPIRTKRWNDPPDPDDGYRLLVCRHRPRGVRRDDEPWDTWCEHLAPSAELVAAFYGKDGTPPMAWDEYRRRYLDEMATKRFWIEGFADHLRNGDALTLLCSSACVDATRCHRTVLAELLQAAAFPASPTHLDTTARARVIRRGRPG